MSAGLPGIGLGGLFFILSALLAPLVEIARTLRGTSSVDAWIGVARNFVLAVVMIVAIEATLRLAQLAIAGVGPEGAGEGGGALAMPLIPVGITAALLTAVLFGAKVMQVASARRPGA